MPDKPAQTPAGDPAPSETIAKKAAVRRKAAELAPAGGNPAHDEGLAREAAALKEQLAAARIERRLLVESINCLTRLLATAQVAPARGPAAEGPQPFSDGTEPWSVPEGEIRVTPVFREMKPQRSAGRCTITESNIRAIVYGAILALDHDAPIPIEDSTKLGTGGLGWDGTTKRLIFNPIRDGVMGHGCDLGLTAGEMEPLATVGAVVELVRDRVLRRI